MIKVDNIHNKIDGKFSVYKGIYAVNRKLIF